MTELVEESSDAVEFMVQQFPQSALAQKFNALLYSEYRDRAAMDLLIWAPEAHEFKYAEDNSWASAVYLDLGNKERRVIVRRGSRHEAVLEFALVGSVEERWCSRHERPAVCPCRACEAKVCPTCYAEEEARHEAQMYGGD